MEREALDLAQELSLHNGVVGAYRSTDTDQLFILTHMVTPNTYDERLGLYYNGSRLK